MRFLSTIVVLTAALALPATAGAQATDYTKTAGLTQPQYQTVRDVLRIPAFDGRELYVEVTRPKAAGRFPVILEATPYHGTLADREGTRILPEPRDADGTSLGLTGYFAPAGLRRGDDGPARHRPSQGCLDHLGPERRARPRADRRMGGRPSSGRTAASA